MALLPCQIDSDHCWGHHPGSGDCLEFRPRGCTEVQIDRAIRNRWGVKQHPVGGGSAEQTSGNGLDKLDPDYPHGRC